MSFCVAPGLLIAMPSLLDPNFFRSVVLLCAHSSEGAFGLVVNAPLEIDVAAICAEAGIDWEGPSETKVYSGGPVERQRGWLIHDASATYAGSQAIAEGVALTTSQEGLQAYGQQPLGRFRLLLGYAGWGPGQLDREITSGSWLTAPMDQDIVFSTRPETVWRAALASVGVDPAHLVDGGTGLN